MEQEVLNFLHALESQVILYDFYAVEYGTHGYVELDRATCCFLVLLEYHVHNKLDLIQSLLIKHSVNVILCHLECLCGKAVLSLIAALDHYPLALIVGSPLYLRVKLLNVYYALRLRFLL